MGRQVVVLSSWFFLHTMETVSTGEAPLCVYMQLSVDFGAYLVNMDALQTGSPLEHFWEHWILVGVRSPKEKSKASADAQMFCGKACLLSV